MTDNTFAEAPPEETEGDANRRRLMLAGAGLGVVVLGGGGWLLLHGGSSDDSTAFTVPHRTHKVAPKAEQAATKTNKPIQLPAASSVTIGRDPFAALYVVPVAVEAPAAGGATGGASGTGGTGDTGSTGVTPGVVAPTSYKLQLVKISGSGAARTASFSVDGKTQLARVGSVFGKTSELKLLSFQQSTNGVWSVTIQVGDDDPKDMALREVISVM